MPARILLDTSYLYGLMESPGRLSSAEREFLSDQGVRLYVSAVSIWEMRLKYHARTSSGKRKSPFDPRNAVAMLEEQGVIFLPMTGAHAARELETPTRHRDPFDELLLAQAQEEGLRLLTADRELSSHPLAVTVQDLPDQ